MEIPGKIVLVDDQQADIEDLMSEFMRSGHGCIFVRNTDDILEPVSGIRLVVLDLDIDEDGQITEGDTRQLALILSRLIDTTTTFFLMAVWSKQITGDNDDAKQFIEDIKVAYKDITGYNLMGFFLPSMSKKNLSHNEVLVEVEKWVEFNPHVGLCFEWERLLETARDTTLSSLLDLEGRNIYNIVKVLYESAMGGVERELIRLFNKVLLRNMTKSNNIRSVNNILESINNERCGNGIDLDWYSRFHFLQTYYDPKSDDPIWTGDIIEFENKEASKQLAVVITPQCDLAQGKTNRIKVVYGVKVDNIDENQERAYQISFPDKPFKNNEGSKTESAKNFLCRISGKISGLSEHFYVFHHIHRDNINFHLLLDLRHTETLETIQVFEEMQKGKANRICRVDSPDIEDLLQKYSAISARVGVFQIPGPYMDEDANQLIGECS